MKQNLLFTLCLSLLSFMLVGQSTIGIIGSATGGWTDDIDMIQDAVDSNLWTIEYDLQPDVDGNAELKFRADNDWALSWGGSGFPAGTAITDNGPNIPIRVPGMYKIQFNSSTGVYYLESGSSIGIIGEATVLGWDQDIDMFNDPTDPNKFFVTLDLTAGGCKFRMDNDWPINWGGPNFPTGIGELGSSDNIPVAFDGEYRITIDTSTKEYIFEETNPYMTIGIIGDAVMGWDEDVDMIRNVDNPSEWTLVYDLKEGPIKFRANDDWPINWGGTDFPTGTGVDNSNENIPVSPSGKYNIKFNTDDFSYSFEPVEDYTTISISGTASGDFNTFFAMDRVDPTGFEYTLRTQLMDGELIFVANEDNTINWGGADFPSGIAERDGATVPVTEGEYVITFNYVTGAYNFRQIFEYGQVSLVGKSGPTGAWPEPDDNGAQDTYLTKDATDGNLWLGTGLALTAYAGASDDGIKFRAETDWTTNWGAEEFPAGVGVPNGPNIQCTEGEFNVAFNSSNGEYAFSPATSTDDILKPNDIKLYPNPAQDIINIEMDYSNITGEVTVSIIDATGRVVLSDTNQYHGSISINTSTLNTGNYFVKITGSNLFVGKNLTIVK